MAEFIRPLTGRYGMIPRYFLQSFRDCDTVPYAGLGAPEQGEMERYAALLAPVAESVKLR